MNNPQLWGALRGVAIAIGGALISMGVLKLTTEELNALISNATAVFIAVGGLASVVVPMYQGWKSRSRKAIIETAAEQPGVAKVTLTSSAEAAAIPSTKVVGPAGI